MTGNTVDAIQGVPKLLLGKYDLAELGYEATEFFIGGEATSYEPVGALTNDGHWSVREAARAAFRTRLVVLKPIDPTRFSGSVMVEWLNVTAGVDAAVEWGMAHREMARAGHAYVAVSAQRVGVEGGKSRGFNQSLKKLDPVRYASLHHPGDAFAYDIFSQVGRLVKDRPEELLGTSRPQRVIAVGESQAAWYFVTYLNAIDPTAQVYDGFLVHSRFASVAPLDGTSIFAKEPTTMPAAAKLREDLRVPVLTVITETDLIGGIRPGYYRVGQKDGPNLRTWEITGSAHADNYTLKTAQIDSGTIPIEQLAVSFAPTRFVFGLPLPQKINFAPQHHYVVQAALAALDRWVDTGEVPTSASPIALSDTVPPVIVADDDAIAVGGVRTPWVDVPVARTSGSGNFGFFRLMGSGKLFGKGKLKRLYPGGKNEYLRRFGESVDETIKRGFLLSDDRQEILALADASWPAANP